MAQCCFPDRTKAIDAIIRSIVRLLKKASTKSKSFVEGLVRGGWVALALLVGVPTMGQSQPAVSAQTNQTQTYKSQVVGSASEARVDFQLADQLPPPTVLHHPQNTDGKAEASTDRSDTAAPKYRWIPSDPNWVIAIFTIVLAFAAIFQIIAAFLQWNAMSKQNEVALIAAEAARLSARAAVGVELPRVFLSKCEFAESDKPSEAQLQYPELEMAVSNYGRTPAFPIEVSIEIVCGAALPPEPRYSRTDPFPTGSVIRDQPYRLIPLAPHFSAEDAIAVASEKKFIWVYGYVAYKDFLNDEHKCRFCQKLCKMPHPIDNGGVGRTLYAFDDWDENHKYIE